VGDTKGMPPETADEVPLVAEDMGGAGMVEEMEVTAIEEERAMLAAMAVAAVVSLSLLGLMTAVLAPVRSSSSIMAAVTLLLAWLLPSLAMSAVTLSLAWLPLSLAMAVAMLLSLLLFSLASFSLATVAATILRLLLSLVGGRELTMDTKVISGDTGLVGGAFRRVRVGKRGEGGVGREIPPLRAR